MNRLRTEGNTGSRCSKRRFSIHTLTIPAMPADRKELPCKEWIAEPLQTRFLSKGLILTDQGATIILRDRQMPTNRKLMPDNHIL